MQPDDLDGAGMQEIVDVLGSIAARENAEDGASAAELMPAYERLEALVSLRFRLTMQSASAASTHDVRPWAVRWDAHVLQLRVLADGETVHVAGLWTAPDGRRRAFLHPVTVAQARLLGEVTGIPDALAVPAGDPPADPPQNLTHGVRAQAPGWRRSPRFRHLVSANPAAWTELATLLLPAGLLEELRGVDPAGAVPKLLLVPDSFLWRMPWAALQIEPDHGEGHLVDRAVLATLPSLSLLEDTAAPGGGDLARGVVGYLAGVNAGGMDIERQALADVYGKDFTAATTTAEFLDALTPGRPRPALVAASVHGDRRPGLAHGLALAPGVKLTAARMLTLRFPPVLMINACLSAELDERHGPDPLGIPTVALCRGADAVIGGIFPLPDGEAGNPEWSHSTARILAILYQLLADGVPPSSALRAAQRRWRRERGWTPPYLWAGLVSITTRLDTKATSLLGFVSAISLFLAVQKADGWLKLLAFCALGGAGWLGLQAMRVRPFADAPEPRPLYSHIQGEREAKALDLLIRAQIQAYEKNRKIHESKATQWRWSLGLLALAVGMTIIALVFGGQHARDRQPAAEPIAPAAASRLRHGRPMRRSSRV